MLCRVYMYHPIHLLAEGYSLLAKIYGHENEMYNVGVSLKEVECL